MKPKFWPQACAELSKSDSVMAELIALYHGELLSSRGQAFETLARSIVGQQISVKAAETVWNRFLVLVDAPTPENVLRFKVTELKSAGLSLRKAEYVREMAEKFDSKTINPRKWHSMSDDEVIADLCELRGIGRWTAEMFLIFHLLRPNVFPMDDIGLMRALSKCYGKRYPISRRQLQLFQKKFAPWCSVATWYLWRHLDPVPVEY